MEDPPSQIQKDFLLITKVSAGFEQVLKTVTYLGLAYFAVQATRALAGLSTDARLVVGWFTSADNNWNVHWIVTAVAVFWARRESVLRRNKTEQMQSQIKELERRLDPRRSSSGLTPTGDTNPEDKE